MLILRLESPKRQEPGRPLTPSESQGNRITPAGYFGLSPSADQAVFLGFSP